MTFEERALIYNREMKDTLSMIWNELNYGQQKKLARNENIRALLIKFDIITEDFK